MADFVLAAQEVAAWNEMPIGESFVMDNSNGAFQELRISAELPADGN